MTALVVNARMYAPAAAAAAAWRASFAWVAERSGIALDPVDHGFPAPLEALWARDDLGAVFMCGWPFARGAFTHAGARHRIVAAPVPAAPRYGDRPVYFTDFVVRADSEIRTLEDSFGGRLAYTVDHSQSGYNAPRHHLLRFRSADRPTLYAAVVGPCVTPRRVLDAVLDGAADVAPLDGYTLELMLRHTPGLGDRIRIVASTEPTPMPPLVASPGIPDATVAALRAAFLAFGEAADTGALRAELGLARFAVTAPADYDVTLAWAAEAEAAGYPVPG